MSTRPRTLVLRSCALTLSSAVLFAGCDVEQEPMGPDPASAVVAAASGAGSTRRSNAVCHRSNGRVGYRSIQVAEPAVRSHLRHGDALPGDPVPDQPGMVFGADCQAEPSLALLSPAAGAVLDNGCSIATDPIVWEFDWSDVPDAERYHLFVIGARATIPIIDAQYLRASEFREISYGYIIERHRTGWTWKVRAYTAGEWGPWTEERVFDVEPLNTDCPS